MNPRRLVLCLDGTWNNTYSVKKRNDGHAVLKPSNVLKLARAVLPHDSATDRQQIVYYDVGVGSLTKYPGGSNRLLASIDKTLGGGWGAGFETNIERALAFLVLNHQLDDEVFVFGFSRGAATAQAVTRFLDWSGGLPIKRDAYYLPRLFREYVLSRGARSRDVVVERVNSQRAAERRPLPPLAPFRPIDVVILGVWDTVMALGSRFRAAGAHTSTRSRSFHVGAHPARCVRHARQALAIDEARYDFRPEIWTDTSEAGQTLQQRWFAGAHSNIGGGYVDDGLANLAFRWMLKEAESRGLVVDAGFVAKYRGYAQDRLYRSESMFYRALDAVRWRAGRGRRSLTGVAESANLTLDPSVIWRIQTNPSEQVPGDPAQLQHPELRTPYGPDNVLQFLASQPDVDVYLTRLGINPPVLPGDVRKRIADLHARHFPQG
jgi:uncharacterized protein (DUF2235 family)